MSESTNNATNKAVYEGGVATLINKIDGLLPQIAYGAASGPIYRHGYEIGNNLYSSAGAETIQDARTRVSEWAKTQVLATIPTHDETLGSEELENLRIKIKNITPEVERLREHYRIEKSQIAEHSEELAALSSVLMKEPNQWKFGFTGALLGVIFGLLATTTIVDIMMMIVEPMDPEEVRGIFVGYSAIIGIFVGLSIGLMMLPIQKYTVGGKGFFIKHAPVLMGLFFAIGLGTYRLMGQDPDTGQFILRMTPLGFVMIFLEMAILFGIEATNATLGYAYARWYEVQVPFDKCEARLKKEEQEAKDAKQALDECLQKQELLEVGYAETKRNIYRVLTLMKHRDDHAKHAVEEALAGLEKGFGDKLQKHNG